MASDIRPKYRVAWGSGERAGRSGGPGGSVPVTSASPAPTPSAMRMPSAICRSDQHDCARLRPLAQSVTGTPISDRVKDRDINLAGDANRSAHRARRSFKAKAGSRRRPSQGDVPSGPAAGPPCPAPISAAALNLSGRSCRRRGTAAQLPSNYAGTVDVTSMTVMDPACAGLSLESQLQGCVRNVPLSPARQARD
jgi:hypothetical protein